MKIVKEIASFLIVATLIGISVSANAEDIKFNNNTNYTLSFGINGVCSNVFGNIEKDSVKSIDHAMFEESCKYNPSQCSIDVYTQSSCTGNSVANMTFNQASLVNVAIALNGNVMIKRNGPNVIFK